MLDLVNVALLAGMPTQTLKNWVTQGHVRPTVPGRQAPGGQARFDIPAAVGIVVAYRVYSSERGCVFEFVKKLAAAFSSVSEEWLRAQFDKGCTHLVTVHYGRPLLRGKAYDWVDVRAAYDEVREKAAEVEAVASGPTAR